ncbi:MAG: helix-turn-helix transcriptional regulator [Elusimicrobia bacterium]|nr:helix-turn-helix transcriptional regulator [Elusimicrobiota bacterium]
MIINVGSKVKEILKLKNITQTQLAKKLGVHKQSLTVWLNGNKNPRIETIAKIAEILNVPIIDLLETKTKNIAKTNSNDTESISRMDLLEEKIKRHEIEIKYLKEEMKRFKQK